MIQQMRTFICSVVFLDLVGFSKNPVDEQIVLKEHLNGLISETIADFPESEYIILDCGDGAAIGFVGDPEYALFFAMNLRDTIVKKGSGMIARIGINLGPVKLVKDINGHPNLIGDGINVAQRIMNFAEPNQVTVSRSFHEVTSCLSRDIADLYHYLGSRTDKNIRKYQVYTIGNPHLNHQKASSMPTSTGEFDTHCGAAIGSAGNAEESTQSSTAAEWKNFSFFPTTLGKNKRLYGLCAIAVIAAVSFVLLQLKGKTTGTEQKKTGKNMVRPFDLQTSARKMNEEKNLFAVIQFKISPQGVIYIDGEKKGVAPMLRELQVKKGEHTIAINYKHYKAYRRVVNLAPQERILIKHSFHKNTATAATKKMTVGKSTSKGKKAPQKINPAAFNVGFTPK